MTTLVFGGKNGKSNKMKGGGLMDIAKNVGSTGMEIAGNVLHRGASMVKGGTVAETTQDGGRRRRRRRSSARSTSRSRKLRKRTGKVRRHATRSYRRKKRTRRS